MISGRMHIHGISTSPVHHGGETAGNTQMVRRQTIADPETGETRRVPFVSGRSVKHLIREWGARFALSAMGWTDAFTKAQRDLLISGGTFSSGGSSVDLEAARTLERAFPILAVCGYAAGNRGAASKLNVDNWHMLCRENRWRVYDRLAREVNEETGDGQKIAAALDHRAAEYLDEDFGTRHEPKDPNVNKLLEDQERKRLESEAADKLGQAHPDKGDSIQMIYEYEQVVPGAQWMGCIHYRELTELEAAALTGALHHACEDTVVGGRKVYRVGGKSSVGLGAVAVRFFGSLREDIRPPEHIDSDAMVAWDEDDSAMQGYVEHLREHKDQMVDAMEALL